ncbi:ATP-grasp domain-containing protein [Nocardia sp. NPDC004123]
MPYSSDDHRILGHVNTFRNTVGPIGGSDTVWTESPGAARGWVARALERTAHPGTERTVALVTDHDSREDSRTVLAGAIARVTGRTPISFDARKLMGGGPATVVIDRRDGLTLRHPHYGRISPDVVVVYEIHPNDRVRFSRIQRALADAGTPCLDAADAEAWTNATDKARTVECFARHSIPHAETAQIRDNNMTAALAAFQRLGHDVWTRPVTGLGGRDVFHVTTPEMLATVGARYAELGQQWLISRDAGNFDRHGRRHQFRIVVLGERILRVCEHVQDDPDAPCNEAQGARSTVLPAQSLPTGIAELAVAATRSLGLTFGGVDLCPENGGTVFEVNVHPVLNVPGGLESVAIPLIQAYLEAPDRRRTYRRAELNTRSEAE